MAATIEKELVRAARSQLIMEPDDADRKWARYERARTELAVIERRMRNGFDALPMHYHRHSHDEILAALEKRREELRNIVAAEPPERKVTRRWGGRQAAPTAEQRVLRQFRGDAGDEWRRWIGNEDIIQWILEHHHPINCNTITIGQVHASDARYYAWNTPQVGGTTSDWGFWPLSRGPSPGFYNGSWSGETGGVFGVSVDVPSSWGIDPIDSIAIATVFQFTIPAPQCNASLYWGTSAVAHIGAPWQCDGDFAFVNTNWMLSERPSGGGFPASATTDFNWINEGLYTGTEDATDPRAYTSFDRSFPVAGGASPEIYLGISAMAMAEDGSASTNGFGSDFEFEYGVTYIMVSQAP